MLQALKVVPTHGHKMMLEILTYNIFYFKLKTSESYLETTALSIIQFNFN